jgi:hypothetical protein
MDEGELEDRPFIVLFLYRLYKYSFTHVVVGAHCHFTSLSDLTLETELNKSNNLSMFGSVVTPI